MRINKEWHENNKMPKNANDEVRYEWHLEHQKHCTCREIPNSLIEKFNKKGI